MTVRLGCRAWMVKHHRDRIRNGPCTVVHGVLGRHAVAGVVVLLVQVLLLVLLVLLVVLVVQPKVVGPSNVVAVGCGCAATAPRGRSGSSSKGSSNTAALNEGPPCAAAGAGLDKPSNQFLGYPGFFGSISNWTRRQSNSSSN